MYTCILNVSMRMYECITVRMYRRDTRTKRRFRPRFKYVFKGSHKMATEERNRGASCHAVPAGPSDKGSVEARQSVWK